MTDPTIDQAEKIKLLKEFCDKNGIDYSDEEEDELNPGNPVIIAIYYGTYTG